jgi:hypothetical protein
MPDKIFIFGDSFMYGEESHQHEFDEAEFLKDASDAVGTKIELDHHGVPTKPFTDTQRDKYIKFINGSIKRSSIHPNYYSMGAILARKLNCEYDMQATSGNSNNAIYKTFIDCIPKMTSDSLVLFGLSVPNRKTYYEQWIDRHPVNHVTSCWSDVTAEPGYGKFEELDLLYGDDATARVLQTYSFVTSAKSISPCPVLFIDPFHNFCDNKYHPDVPWNYVRRWSDQSQEDLKTFKQTYPHPELLYWLEEQFKSLFVYGISEVFEEVTADGQPIQCINGHYSKYTYERYVDKVLLNEI